MKSAGFHGHEIRRISCQMSQGPMVLFFCADSRTPMHCQWWIKDFAFKAPCVCVCVRARVCVCVCVCWGLGPVTECRNVYILKTLRVKIKEFENLGGGGGQEGMHRWCLLEPPLIIFYFCSFCQKEILWTKSDYLDICTKHKCTDDDKCT